MDWETLKTASRRVSEIVSHRKLSDKVSNALGTFDLSRSSRRSLHLLMLLVTSTPRYLTAFFLFLLFLFYTYCQVCCKFGAFIWCGSCVLFFMVSSIFKFLFFFSFRSFSCGKTSDNCNKTIIHLGLSKC